MNRRFWLKTSLASLIAANSGCRCKPLPLQVAVDELPWLSLTDLGRYLQSGHLTSGRLLQSFVERVERIDRSGPAIRSIIELNPEAGSIAAQMDGQRQRAGEGATLGPLHGLLILIKDNIETADAMETAAGSLALLGAPKPAQDATLVRKLRDAGMVIAGKTNLSEWANFRSSNSTSGWSARGGLTLNPHKLTHSASGSSSGSAAAVAAGLVAAAIGTETNGSIVSPASACGIVGFKPTVGLVSRAGIIPITHWQDTAGPMTRTVYDAALLMNVISGADDRDPQTVVQNGLTKDCTGLLEADALKDVRLGVLRSQCGNHPEVQRVLEAALNSLRDAGAELVEVSELPNEKYFGRLSMQAMLTEFRADLNQYLQKRGGSITSLAELIEYNKKNEREEMPYFTQEFFEESERRHTPEASDLAQKARAAASLLAGPEGIDAALKEHRLDALICATNDPASVINLQTGDPHVRCASTPAAVAGYPHLTVPMGFVDDLPVGLSFIGAAHTDPKVLAYGHAFQHHHPVRCKSRILE